MGHVQGDAAQRKAQPLFSGVLRYFPDALLEVAALSKVGNDQHNPGQPLHWAKEKSRDEGDCIMRHLVDVGTKDTDGVRHATKVAWRALALLQREIERERGYDYNPKTDKWEKVVKIVADNIFQSITLPAGTLLDHYMKSDGGGIR